MRSWHLMVDCCILLQCLHCCLIFISQLRPQDLQGPTRMHKMVAFDESSSSSLPLSSSPGSPWSISTRASCVCVQMKDNDAFLRQCERDVTASSRSRSLIEWWPFDISMNRSHRLVWGHQQWLQCLKCLPLMVLMVESLNHLHFGESALLTLWT